MDPAPRPAPGREGTREKRKKGEGVRVEKDNYVGEKRSKEERRGREEIKSKRKKGRGKRRRDGMKE